MAAINNRSKSVILDNEDNYYHKSKNLLTDMVYEHLISKLMNKEIVPGQVLSRRQLAEELGVSIAPVVEALNRIELEGFIESIPRKGTIVRPVKKQDFYERFIMREAIECTAARLYTGLPVQWNKDELMEYASKIDKMEHQTISHSKVEIIFHSSLVNLAGIPLLTNEFLRVARVGTFCMINQVDFDHGLIHYEHVNLIEQLTKSSPDEAEKIVREHIWSGNPIRAKYDLIPGLIRD